MTEAVKDSRTVSERIADALQDIAAVDFAKSGTVKVGGRESYNFIPIKDILDAVRKAHARHGIIVIFGRPEYDPEEGEKRYSYVKKSSYDGKESTWYAANGHIDVRIMGRLGDSIEITVPCEAQDNSDKLTNKLITNAERCLYRTLYVIDEGGDSDPEAVNEPMVDAFFGSNRRAMARAAPGFDSGADRLRERREAEASVNLKDAKAMLAKVLNEAPGSIDRYVQMHGMKLSEWPEEDIRKAYVEVMEGSE